MPKIKKQLEPRDPKVRKLLEAFDEAARAHGWEQDQGVGREVDSAAADYLRTRNALVRRLNRPKIVHVLMTMHPGRDQARAIFSSKKKGDQWLRGRQLPGDGCYYEDYELDPEAK